MLRQRCLGREPTRFEDASDGEPYLGVRGRGPGGEPDTDRSVGKPAPLLDLLLGVQRRAGWLMEDDVALDAVAARYVVAPRYPLGGDDRQVVGVRGEIGRASCRERV